MSDRLAKERLLNMYVELSEGHMLYKSVEAQKYGCAERSIQRDFDDLRSFFSDRGLETGFTQDLVYDRKEKGYKLNPPSRNVLTNEETFAVLKVLLESRSLVKDELGPILEKLVQCCVPPEKRPQVNELIANEKYHYVEPHHHSKVLMKMWELSEALRTKRYVQVKYKKQDLSEVERKLKPVGIMFSEFYYYLIAYIDDGAGVNEDVLHKHDNFPVIYRIDRIEEYTILDEHFKIPYESRFEEGEFRKRIQFMYGGKLQHIKFWFKGDSIDAVLDRLPTAEIIGEDPKKGKLVKAEVFGTGIDMWLRSQGDWIEVVEQK